MVDAELGAQSSATCNVAIAVESTSGVAATAPSVYMVMGGDITPVPKKGVDSRDIAGSMFPSLGVRQVETFEIPLPMLPVLEDATSPVIRRNGLGELLLCLFGANTSTQQASTVAYLKNFTWENLIKTFTLWLHYDTNSNEKVRMNAIDSFDVGLKAGGGLTLDFKAMGAELWDVLDTDYGTEAQPDIATSKQVTALGSRLEFGQPGAAVRSDWDEIKLGFKRNLSFGGPGKDGQHPAASGSPRNVTSSKSNVEVAITLRDRAREEIKRAREGVNTAPTASRQTDTPGLVKLRLSMYGPAICAGINGEEDYCNAGTTTGAFAGSYTGGSTVEVGEIEMSDSDIYETALGSNKDLSFKLLDTDATYTVETGAGALSVAVVAKAITVTLAAAGSTASAVLAALLANSDVTPLLTPTLANGSTGAGTISDAQATITASDFKDGFKYRYTTGSGWSTWTAWIKVTEAAQNLHAGITCDFSDDDAAKAGDKFYYCSHYRYMLRFTLPDLGYKDAAKPKFAGGVRQADIELYHPNTANGPTIDLVDQRTTAFS